MLPPVDLAVFNRNYARIVPNIARFSGGGLLSRREPAGRRGSRFFPIDRNGEQLGSEEYRQVPASVDRECELLGEHVMTLDRQLIDTIK
jgi:hypothetical protein